MITIVFEASRTLGKLKVCRQAAEVLGARDGADGPASFRQFVDGVVRLLQRQACSEQAARDGYRLIKCAGSAQHDDHRLLRRQWGAGYVPDWPQTFEARLQF